MYTIQQLSQELNIGVDTLRVWERRYGFPRPDRDDRGHRCYSTSQLDDLRTVKRLQGLGYRPGKIFKLKRQQRLDILNNHREEFDPELQEYAVAITAGDIAHLLGMFERYLDEHGLDNLVLNRLVPIIEMLDQQWTEGSLSISREHLISDMISDLLRRQIQRSQSDGGCRITFLTLSNERHKLGLLMSAAIFSATGAECLVIHEELPLSEVAQVVSDTQCHALALSFSQHYSARRAKKDIAALRNQLDRSIWLIAGGEAMGDSIHLPGLVLCQNLSDIPVILKKLKSSISSSQGAEAT